MTDIDIAWRDEQIEMLRDEIRRLQAALAAMTIRAEQAEERCRNLTEEVLECLPTP